MLSLKDIKYVIKSTESKVNTILNEIGFDPTVKEPGHSFGEKFEEVLVSSLVKDNNKTFSLPTKTKGKGKQTRNMEDLFAFGKSVNIKFGYHKNGNPNICSFNRLLEKYHVGEIDSYWLLTINVKDRKKDGTFDYECHFFNIYDYLDYVNYDYGTGQVMLKEAKFFGDYSLEDNKQLTKKQHMKKLKSINQKAFEGHIKRKTEQNNKRCQIFDEYK